MPFEVLLAASFVGLLVLCAGFTTMTGVRHDGLALLCALVAVACWGASPWAAVAVGTLAWPFYLGWVVRDDGELTLRGWTDPLVLAAFLGIALAVVTLRRVMTWPARKRGAGARAMTGGNVEPVDAAALFHRFPRRSPRSRAGGAGPNGTRPAEKANQV